MNDSFRNLEGSAQMPLEHWPYEALVASIEQGTMRDWLALLAAIEREPWGAVARRVEQYLGYASPYGVGPLLQRRITRSRARAREHERAAVATEVSCLISRSGLSTEQFASATATSRSRLSTYAAGKVVPAATLMVRMRAVSARAEAAAHAMSSTTFSARERCRGASTE